MPMLGKQGASCEHVRIATCKPGCCSNGANERADRPHNLTSSLHSTVQGWLLRRTTTIHSTAMLGCAFADVHSCCTKARLPPEASRLADRQKSDRKRIWTANIVEMYRLNIWTLPQPTQAPIACMAWQHTFNARPPSAYHNAFVHL